MKTIEEMAATLGADQTGRFVCPVCHGGRSEERSFAVTRYTKGYAFFCHRASCGFRGTTWDSSGLLSEAPGETAVRYGLDDSYQRATAGHPAGQHPDFAYTWHAIDYVPFGVYFRSWPRDGYAVAFKMMDCYEYEVGIHYRARAGLTGSKYCSTTRNPEYPYRHVQPHACYMKSAKDPEHILLVEDPISAIRVAASDSRLAAVALLSARAEAPLIQHLHSRWPLASMTMALDRDATLSAIGQVMKLRQETGVSILPVFLKQDLKNMTREDFAAQMQVI